ncbi:transglycosylase SLT domain-containing protein [Tropicimonas sp. S265A]|uniref:lytic transglycosylase domain-containing protein n=1 Tax=Tropicimonas sp. S265A TaxID=3415134 RepID=UPI003C7AFFD7
MTPIARILGPAAVCLMLSVLTATAGQLSDALQAARGGDWTQAQRLSLRLPTEQRDVVSWTSLRAGKGEWSFYRDFLARNPDWPGLPLLRRAGEGVIPTNALAGDVIAYFAAAAPQTGTGALRLAAALRSRGDLAGAEAVIVEAWKTMTLSESEFTAILRDYWNEVTPHNVERLDMLLWNGRTTAARRMFDLVPEGWRRLAEARIALRTAAPGVDGLIARVPSSLSADAGLAYERFQWRARKGRFESAAEILAARSTSSASLGRPEEWANRRRGIARDFMRDDKNRAAYELASKHFLTEGRHFADLEWLSGFLALRKLDDPEAALAHFRRFRGAVFTPISLGRAGYWEGRALEALGRTEDARAAYAFAAEYQTSFYGQLAAERAGLPTDPAVIGRESYPGWTSTPYAKSTIFAAGDALMKEGERDLAERFFRHLAERLTAEEIGSLAQYTLDAGEFHIALRLAKYAAGRGDILHRPYHPIAPLGDDLPVSRALALAVARRESEFDPVVISPAGARGMMQLMPGTAKEMARALGEPYDLGRLLTDPAQNARFGSAYLARLIGDFGENLTLIAIGYNAGPGRARSWPDRFGDPRGMSEDQIVDWIEHIPFRETRSYVMRVAESRGVYGMRLAGEVGPWNVVERLTAR